MLKRVLGAGAAFVVDVEVIAGAVVVFDLRREGSTTSQSSRGRNSFTVVYVLESHAS
jgi:hypothetical protein